MIRFQEDTEQYSVAEEQKASEQQTSGHNNIQRSNNERRPDCNIFSNDSVFKLIETGNVQKLMEILEKNREVLFFRSFKNSMIIAMKNGHDDVVIFLSSIGADKSFNQYTIDVAAKYGRKELVEYLYDNRNDGFTLDAIVNAARNGHMDIVTYLQSKRC